MAPHRRVVSDPDSVPGDAGPRAGRCVRSPGLPGRQDLRTRLTVKKEMRQHSRRSSVLRQRSGPVRAGACLLWRCRRAFRHPLHPRLHRNVLLRIPRKGESRRGVSLMKAHPSAVAPTWLQRVGWLVLIWTASVLALGVVAGLFRVVMNLAGLTV